MANTEFTLVKKEYNKNQYQKVIDTSFSQLGPSNPTPVATPTNTQEQINQFFQTYQTLFFDIPKFGETNSHEYLIKTSQDYVGSTFNDEEVQILLEEITSLRQTNLDLNQLIVNLSQTGSING